MDYSPFRKRLGVHLMGFLMPVEFMHMEEEGGVHKIFDKNRGAS